MKLFFIQLEVQGVVFLTPAHQEHIIAESAFHQGNGRLEPTTLKLINDTSTCKYSWAGTMSSDTCMFNIIICIWNFTTLRDSLYVAVESVINFYQHPKDSGMDTVN